MSELARRIAARLREFIGDRRRARHCRARLLFSVSVVGQKPTSNGAQRPRSIDGHTLDISATGLALVVPAIRVGEQYLMGENRRLEIRLELPEGTVAMQAIPVRYESLEDGTENGYLIGVQVEQMTEQDRDQYIAYVNGLLQK
jgi:hypothetical protein